MKSLFLVPFFLISSATYSNSVDLERLNSSGEASNICYFSLNNEKEFEVMSDFTKKLNAHSTHKINVTEYQTLNTNPEVSFKKMIESGARCDGLVISGHHTGAFGGKRAQGQLDIGFLEKLSCDPKYKDFFQNIKSLWLQGCRTMGQKVVSLTETLTQDILSNENTAQHHVGRVGNVAGEDSLEASFENLESNYAAVMDQDNPLGTRYLRVFPRASVFGWTKSSPGEKAGSHWSLPFHIAHISRVLDPDKAEYFKDPSKYMTAEVAARYAEILTATLQNGNPEYEQFAQCLGLDKKELVEAWENHGRKRGNRDAMSFNNPDLKAFASYDEAEQQKLMEAKVLGCQMGNANKENVLAALEKSLSDISLIGPNYNIILNLLKSKDTELSSQVREMLEKSEKFKNFLDKKIMSEETGVLTKLELIKTSDDLYKDNLNEKYKEKIRGYSIQILNLKDQRNWALQEYKRALVKRLSKLDYDLYDMFIKKNEVNYDGLERIMDTIKYDDSPMALSFFENIIKNPNTSYKKLRIAFEYLIKRKSGDDLEEILESILKHPHSNSRNHLDVAKAVYFKSPENSQELLKSLLSFKNAGSITLSYVIKSTDRNEKLDKKEIFQEVLKQKNLDDKILDMLVERLPSLDDSSRGEIEVLISKKRK